MQGQESPKVPTFGDRLADKVAEFGGSWGFIGFFFASMAIWMAFNLWEKRAQPRDAFDPYPFILLNLVLSCLASVQAPIIMMSQNRTEARDRRMALEHKATTEKVERATERIEALDIKIDHHLDRMDRRLISIERRLRGPPRPARKSLRRHVT